jgi:hypothetical protein
MKMTVIRARASASLGRLRDVGSSIPPFSFAGSPLQTHKPTHEQSQIRDLVPLSTLRPDVQIRGFSVRSQDSLVSTVTRLGGWATGV